MNFQYIHLKTIILIYFLSLLILLEHLFSTNYMYLMCFYSIYYFY